LAPELAAPLEGVGIEGELIVAGGDGDGWLAPGIVVENGFGGFESALVAEMPSAATNATGSLMRGGLRGVCGVAEAAEVVGDGVLIAGRDVHGRGSADL